MKAPRLVIAAIVAAGAIVAARAPPSDESETTAIPIALAPTLMPPRPNRFRRLGYRRRGIGPAPIRSAPALDGGLLYIASVDFLTWMAVLRDPRLKRPRDDLRRGRGLSTDSLMDAYRGFVSLAPSEIAPYVESVSSQAPLADDLRFMPQTLQSRVGAREAEYPDLALNSLVLVTSP